MQLTSSPRRALGLVAVGALGMSTVILGVTGTASAATDTWTFTTASGLQQLVIEADPSADCTIDWVIDGAAGGTGVDGNGDPLGAPSPAGRLTATTEAYDGDVFDLFPGSEGGDGAGSTAGAAGTNDSSYGGDGTGGNPNSMAGGGGGGASIVEGPQSTVFGAYGGDGAGAALGNGVGGLDNENLNHVDGVDGTSVGTGNGVISGTVTCTTPDPASPVVDAPGTPTVNWISAGDESATMQIWQGYLPESSSAPVYEYSLDGGAWKKLAASAEYQVEPTITGLTNGETYSVRVRVTVDGVSSDPTAAQEVTPYQPIGAPGDVAVTHTASGGLRITWTASPADGTFPIAGYGVGWNGGQMGGPLCDTAADVLTCDVAAADVPTSSIYWVSVAAFDASGNPGTASDQVTANGVPSAVPTANGDLVRPAGESGSVTPGSSVRITGSGYAPNSTVTLIVYSVPQVLATTVADGEGHIDVTVTLPDDLAAGDHTLVAAGVDAEGNAYYLTLPITVGTDAQLANTGFSAAPVLVAGALALLAGGGLMLAARRRQAA